ncbi:transmembrane protein 223 [Phlebotomus argentipes]|uniref:transmembrane protein 223 n=1 Tax=Phlebotomus argentipes TaxID=94469 RepID=UPI0028937261|nr:transmembrane protein 223 [Phlebotomus argentipes]
MILLSSIVKCRKAVVFSLRRCLPTPGRLYCTRPYDLNTNVAKDVIIFKYENPKFFRYLNIFAVGQFFFWNYLSHFAFTTLRDAPVDRNTSEDLPFWRRVNLGDNKFRNTLTVLCFGIGWSVLAIGWMYTLRSVRFLVLRKGGQSVSLVTYTPFGISNRIMTVPLNCISAVQSRQAARVNLPLKVKNKSFFYILDKRGTFTNSKLFDYTAGLKRNLS